MTTITLDPKLFDYSTITEPLVAVPKSLLHGILKFKAFAKENERKEEEEFVTWQLTAEDILKSEALARKERKAGKLIRL